MRVYKKFNTVFLLTCLIMILGIISCGDKNQKTTSSNNSSTTNSQKDKWGGFMTRQEYVSDENILRDYREYLGTIGISSIKTQHELAGKLAGCMFDECTKYLEKEFSGVPPSSGHNYRADIPKNVVIKIVDDCARKLR